MGFYVTLPSDSSGMYFMENKISGYTIKLPWEVILDGAWECGIAEVHYTITFYNVVSDELTIRKVVSEPNTQNHATQLTIPNGHYWKGDVTETVNKFIADTKAKITINKHTGKVTVATGRQALFMSPGLYEFSEMSLNQTTQTKFSTPAKPMQALGHWWA